jgi:hypothetical protein
MEIEMTSPPPSYDEVMGLGRGSKLDHPSTIQHIYTITNMAHQEPQQPRHQPPDANSTVKYCTTICGKRTNFLYVALCGP